MWSLIIIDDVTMVWNVMSTQGKTVQRFKMVSWAATATVTADRLKAENIYGNGLYSVASRLVLLLLFSVNCLRRVEQFLL